MAVFNQLTSELLTFLTLLVLKDEPLEVLLLDSVLHLGCTGLHCQGGLCRNSKWTSLDKPLSASVKIQ